MLAGVYMVWVLGFSRQGSGLQTACPSPMLAAPTQLLLVCTVIAACVCTLCDLLPLCGCCDLRLDSSFRRHLKHDVQPATGYGQLQPTGCKSAVYCPCPA